MSAYKVTVRTASGLNLNPVIEYAETHRAACRQVLANLPNGWTASARIEDNTSYVRDPWAARETDSTLLEDAT